MLTLREGGHSLLMPMLKLMEETGGTVHGSISVYIYISWRCGPASHRASLTITIAHLKPTQRICMLVVVGRSQSLNMGNFILFTIIPM
jgi:hypothetical protein